jgi:hypothetical protein
VAFKESFLPQGFCFGFRAVFEKLAPLAECAKIENKFVF